jgi:hypothetical protein
MLRCALFGAVVIAVAGCASTAGDISWTARYITPFEKVTKCLAAPSSDAYSVSAETYMRGGTASVTMARRDQPTVTGVYTIQQAAPDATDVTWRRTSTPPGGQQQIDSAARSKADRCGNPYGS